MLVFVVWIHGAEDKKGGPSGASPQVPPALMCHPPFREVKAALAPSSTPPVPLPQAICIIFLEKAVISKAKLSPKQLQAAGPTFWTQTYKSP